ncbi:MAG TPA: serine/threonine protein kinase, partial [Polyangium sp.]|nr:serine/threonine protein kinase [Polyangium sp.]
ERKARKAARKAERAAKRAERLANLREGRPGLPIAVAGLFLFGLTLAQIAVLVSLRAIVPTLLSVLSIFFGKPLRNAAGHVRDAGVTAHEALERAKRRVRGQTEKPVSGMRVAIPKKPVRIRFVEDENTEIEVQEEIAAEEEAADEEKKRRRR